MHLSPVMQIKMSPLVPTDWVLDMFNEEFRAEPRVLIKWPERKGKQNINSTFRWPWLWWSCQWYKEGKKGKNPTKYLSSWKKQFLPGLFPVQDNFSRAFPWQDSLTFVWLADEQLCLASTKRHLFFFQVNWIARGSVVKWWLGTWAPPPTCLARVLAMWPWACHFIICASVSTLVKINCHSIVVTELLKGICDSICERWLTWCLAFIDVKINLLGIITTICSEKQINSTDM